MIISFKDATAGGVPPRVPMLEMDGTFFVRSSSFDSFALTNPTGVPMTSAGIIPLSIISQTEIRPTGGHCR